MRSQIFHVQPFAVEIAPTESQFREAETESKSHPQDTNCFNKAEVVAILSHHPVFEFESLSAEYRKKVHAECWAAVDGRY